MSKTRVLTSPYFRKPNHNRNAAATDNEGEKQQHCFTTTALRSPFFFKSPTSVHASIETLGPFICQLIEPSMDVDPCVRSRHPTNLSLETSCESCQKVLVSVVKHFSSCQDFDMTKIQVPNTNNVDKDNQSCIDILSPLIEYQVRHLCPFGCYLRAYAAYRDWITLRQTLQSNTNVPVVDLLNDWRCCLVSTDWPTKSTIMEKDNLQKEEGNRMNMIQNDECTGANRIKKRRRRRLVTLPTQQDVKYPSSASVSYLPRTVFVEQSTGKTYVGLSKALRALGYYDVDEAYNAYAQKKDGPNKDLIISLSSPKSTKRFICNSNTLSRNWSCNNNNNMKMRILFPPKNLSCQQQIINNNSDNNNKLDAASSPLGLLEELFVNDPWKLLLCTILLNKTRRIQVDTVMHDFLQRWDRPEAIYSTSTNASMICDCISPLGLGHKRSDGIIRFCNDYLNLLQSKMIYMEEKKGEDERTPSGKTSSSTTDVGASVAASTSRGHGQNQNHREEEFKFSRKEILSLYYCGDYAADAYQIFIRHDWKHVQSSDYALQKYVEWKAIVSDSKVNETKPNQVKSRTIH